MAGENAGMQSKHDSLIGSTEVLLHAEGPAFLNITARQDFSDGLSLSLPPSVSQKEIFAASAVQQASV